MLSIKDLVGLYCFVKQFVCRKTKTCVMKKLFVFVILIIMAEYSYSQDIIMLRTGDEVKAQIDEVGTNEIRYRKHENLGGPVYSINKADVFMIKYKNGSKDIFSSSSAPSDNSANAKPSGGLPTAGLASSMEFMNQVYVYNTQNNTLSHLEKGTPEMKVATVAAPFYASSTSTWMMYGASSNVRLDNSGNFAFVIKVAPGIDPTELIRLVKFEVWSENKRDPNSGRNRHMMATKVSGSIGGAASENLSQYDQPFSLKKLEENVYQIIPAKGLLAGEYTFYIMHKFYAFGIN